MLTVKVKTIEEKPVKYLQADCGGPYWEDASVNGVEDTDGSLIPCRDGEAWKPLINLETTKIENWQAGKAASIHYKIVDSGVYSLLDADKNVVVKRDGYVPDMMCPEGGGSGDYVIMEVSEDGTIQNFQVEFSYFEDEDGE